MMEFKECEISGQLVADGEKGQYWIDDSKGIELIRVIATAAGPYSVTLARVSTVEDAVDIANRLDEAGL